MTHFDPSTLFRFVDLFGVYANGLLGGAIARQLGFDVVGFLVVAVTAGLGGGILRDVLLNLTPVALTDPWYFATALIATAISYVIVFENRWIKRTLVLFDLLALGAWAATGASKTLGMGFDIVPAILLGLVTAVGGGVVRDVLIGRVPAIFGGNPLYATFAAIGSVEMVVLQKIGLPTWGMAASILTCGVFGLLARRFGWLLPGALAFTPKIGTWRPWRIVGRSERAKDYAQEHPKKSA